MSFNFKKYLSKPKKKRNCFDFFRYYYLKNKRKKSKLKKDFKKFCLVVGKIIGSLFLLILTLILFFQILDWFESNYRYSIATPSIVGYFISQENGFTANGIYTVSPKEKNNGEKSASLLFGTINCYYDEKYCKEELVSVVNIGGVMMYPHIERYDIKYRDNDRVIYNDDYKTSVVVDLNQKKITKTILKTFSRDKPEKQIDEFIIEQSKISKEEKRVIKKHLRKKFWSY